MNLFIIIKFYELNILASNCLFFGSNAIQLSVVFPEQQFLTRPSVISKVIKFIAKVLEAQSDLNSTKNHFNSMVSVAEQVFSKQNSHELKALK